MNDTYDEHPLTDLPVRQRALLPGDIEIALDERFGEGDQTEQSAADEGKRRRDCRSLDVHTGENHAYEVY